MTSLFEVIVVYFVLSMWTVIITPTVVHNVYKSVKALKWRADRGCLHNGRILVSVVCIVVMVSIWTAATCILVLMTIGWIKRGMV